LVFGWFLCLRLPAVKSVTFGRQVPYFWPSSASLSVPLNHDTKLLKIHHLCKFFAKNPPFLRGIFRAYFARKSKPPKRGHVDMWTWTFWWFLKVQGGL
jgi:hypothetical protein